MATNKKTSFFRRLRVTIHLVFKRLKIPNAYFLDLLAIFVGVATALTAFLFLEGIDLMRWAVGQLQYFVNESLFFTMIPAFGGLLCGLTTLLFSPNAKGQGIPFVIYAVLVKSGLIEQINIQTLEFIQIILV